MSRVVETTPSSVERRQFGLGDLFGWFVVCGAFFAIVGSGAMIGRGLLHAETISASRIWPPTMCWLILLAYFVRKRHYASVLVHTLPAALLSLLVFALDSRLPIGDLALAAGAVSTLFSFPMSVLQSLGTGLQRNLSPPLYMTYRVVGSIILVAAFCTAFPMLFRGVVHWRAVGFGVLLGVWVGLYQAVATSPELAKLRFLGLPARPTVTAGFLAALFGPMICWWADRYVLSNTAYMLWLTPLTCSLPAALIVGWIARWTRREDTRPDS